MSMQFKRSKHISSGYDPCYSSHAEDYFNKQEVQKAFHANVGKWHICRWMASVVHLDVQKSTNHCILVELN